MRVWPGLFLLCIGGCFNPDETEVSGTDSGATDTTAATGTSAPSSSDASGTPASSGGTSTSTTTDSTSTAAETTVETTTTDADTEAATETGSSGECDPDCDGKACGDDGCGGVCGVCAFNFECTDTFECEQLIEGCEETAGYQPGSPWPTLGYCETRIFRSPLTAPTEVPEVLWTLNVGQPLGDLVVAADGTIYGGTVDGRLYAVDPTDGSEVWSVALGIEEALEAPAIAADGSIYVMIQTFLGQSASLNKVTPDGDVEWSYDLGTGVENGTAPLIAADGTVYVVDGSSIVGVDPDGALVFETPFLNSEFGNGGLARGADGRFFVHGENRAYGVAADGTTFWEWTYPGDDYLQQGYPAVSDDGVYFGGRGFGGEIFTLLAQEDGEFLANSPVPTYDDSFAISNTGRIITGFANGGAIAFSFNNGNLFQQWSNGSAPDISGELFDTWAGRLTVDRLGNIFRGWHDGNIYAIGAAGSDLWELDIGFVVNRAIVVAPEETLYVPGGNGLTALRVPE